MKQIFKYFGLFLALYGVLFLIFTTTPLLKAGTDAYRSLSESTMKRLFTKANMYSEPVAMKDGRISVFRIKMTNDAELQQAIKK